jgi:hypothetical protein
VDGRCDAGARRADLSPVNQSSVERAQSPTQRRAARAALPVSGQRFGSSVCGPAGRQTLYGSGPRSLLCEGSRTMETRPMSSGSAAKEFEAFARDCVQLAAQADTPELRERLLSMARDWMRAAIEEDDAAPQPIVLCGAGDFSPHAARRERARELVLCGAQIDLLRAGWAIDSRLVHRVRPRLLDGLGWNPQRCADGRDCCGRYRRSSSCMKNCGACGGATAAFNHRMPRSSAARGKYLVETMCG